MFLKMLVRHVSKCACMYDVNVVCVSCLEAYLCAIRGYLVGGSLFINTFCNRWFGKKVCLQMIIELVTTVPHHPQCSYTHNLREV